MVRRGTDGTVRTRMKESNVTGGGGGRVLDLQWARWANSLSLSEHRMVVTARDQIATRVSKIRHEKTKTVWPRQHP
jgi:hypothetical protein